jgi:hypothetical protein
VLRPRLLSLVQLPYFASMLRPHPTPPQVLLAREGEDLQTLMAQSPEEILLRWVNYHLAKDGVERRATNLGADLKDRRASDGERGATGAPLPGWLLMAAVSCAGSQPAYLRPPPLQ